MPHPGHPPRLTGQPPHCPGLTPPAAVRLPCTSIIAVSDVSVTACIKKFLEDETHSSGAGDRQTNRTCCLQVHWLHCRREASSRSLLPGFLPPELQRYRSQPVGVLKLLPPHSAWLTEAPHPSAARLPLAMVAVPGQGAG